MNKAINYQMFDLVKSQLAPDVQIIDAQVKGKWLVCTLGTKDIKMTTYKDEQRLPATITFSVRN